MGEEYVFLSDAKYNTVQLLTSEKQIYNKDKKTKKKSVLSSVVGILFR